MTELHLFNDENIKLKYNKATEISFVFYCHCSVLYRDEHLQPLFDQLVLKKLRKQCHVLASKKNTTSLLLKKDADSLTDLETTKVIDQWKCYAPLFVQ